MGKKAKEKGRGGKRKVKKRNKGLRKEARGKKENKKEKKGLRRKEDQNSTEMSKVFAFLTEKIKEAVRRKSARKIHIY
jgi:hypothetical protein